MRTDSKLTLLALVFSMGFAGYQYSSIDKPAAVESGNAAVISPVRHSLPVTERTSLTSVAPQETPADTVAESIKQATSDDAATRAKGIAALATAPRVLALPVLLQILDSGEPSIDQPLALQALNSIALQQGDDDGRVREAIRHHVYHTDNAAMSSDAQFMLDKLNQIAQLMP